MNKDIRLLLLEDSPDDVALIKHLLKKEGISFIHETVETKEDYEQKLYLFNPDVVISDHSLPQFNSIKALELFLEYKKRQNPSAAFVLVTGTVSEEFAVQAIKGGADDYILKDRLKRLPSAVLNALIKNRLKEQKRKEEEEKLHLLDILQKSLHEIFIIDPESLLFQYANEEGLRNLGCTLEEILKLKPTDVIPEFREDRFRRILSNVKKSQKGRIYQTYAVRKDRTLYPIQVHLEVIEQGQKKLLLANCLDITETKEHEKQKELALFVQNSFNEDRSLRESLEIILKSLCQQSSVPAAEIWSREYGEELRLNAQWREAGQKEPVAGFFLAEKVYKTGEPLQCEDFGEQLFGSENLIQENYYKGAAAYPIKSGEEITAVMVVFLKEIIKKRDPFVNLREGVQDKLASNIKRKKTEEELQKIFIFSPDILAIIGKDGYVRKINPSWSKKLGYSEEEILTRSFFELIHPDDVSELEKWKNAPLDKGDVAYYESRWRSKNGNYHYFSWSVTSLRENGLQFAVGKDITEHKKQVESIKKQNSRLAEIAWEQSHTVRAPLSRLMSCVAYLEAHEQNREAMISCIKDSAYELDEIVKSIVEKTEEIF